MGLGDPYLDPPRKFFDKWLYRFTYNAHRFRFLCRMNNEIMSVPYNDFYTPSRIAFRQKLIAVNLDTSMGYVMERNQARYSELIKRYKKSMREYKKNCKKLVRSYRKAKEQFYTEKFWEKYLEL